MIPILAILGPMAQASWSYVADFSVGNGNPNGAWSYGIKAPTALDGSLNLFPDSGNSGTFLYWMDVAHSSLGAPATAVNISSNWINGIGPGEGNLHPCANNEIATARWTAPVAGDYRVFGKFGAGDGGAVDVYVYENAASLLTQTSTVADVTFDTVRTLAQGDTLDFMVGNAGSFFNDSTVLDANIEAVPEPASLLAVLAGVAALARRRR